VHNAGNQCQKIFGLYERFRAGTAAANETPYETLMRMKARAMGKKGGIPGNVWRLASKEVNDDMFAKAASGQIGLNKMPSYTDWRSQFSPGLGSKPMTVDDIHIHHVVEKWIQRDKLGLLGDYDAVPGFLIEGPAHTPNKGSLANRLRNEVGPISSSNRLAVTTKIKEIYQSENLHDLWNVAKQWLDLKGVPTPPN